MTRGEACVLGLVRAKRRTKRLVAIKMVGPIPDARNFNVEQHSTIYRGRFQRLHSRERSAPAMRHAIFLINVFLHFLPFLFVRSRQGVFLFQYFHCAGYISHIYKRESYA